MSSLNSFPCRVCLLVISLIYHHSMERSTFTVTMCPFIFSKLQRSLDNLNASISIRLWAIVASCQVIVALKSGEWTELYRTARENDLSSNISKCPHLPFHHKWRSKAQSQNTIIQKTNSHFINIRSLLLVPRASLVAQLIKNPPATQETWAQSLGWEDPLEKGMAMENSTDCIVHGVAKKQTWLRNSLWYLITNEHHWLNVKELCFSVANS